MEIDKEFSEEQVLNIVDGEKASSSTSNHSSSNTDNINNSVCKDRGGLDVSGSSTPPNNQQQMQQSQELKIEEYLTEKTNHLSLSSSSVVSTVSNDSSSSSSATTPSTSTRSSPTSFLATDHSYIKQQPSSQPPQPLMSEVILYNNSISNNSNNNNSSGNSNSNSSSGSSTSGNSNSSGRNNSSVVNNNNNNNNNNGRKGNNRNSRSPVTPPISNKSKDKSNGNGSNNNSPILQQQQQQQQSPQQNSSSKKKPNNCKNVAFGILSKERIMLLMKILQQKNPITSMDQKITIFLSIEEILGLILAELKKRDIPLAKLGIRLVGSTASMIVSSNSKDRNVEDFNDIDLCLYLSCSKKNTFSIILDLEETVIANEVYRQTGIIISKKEVFDNFFKERVKVFNYSNGNNNSNNNNNNNNKSTSSSPSPFTTPSSSPLVEPHTLASLISNSSSLLPLPLPTSNSSTPTINLGTPSILGVSSIPSSPSSTNTSLPHPPSITLPTHLSIPTLSSPKSAPTTPTSSSSSPSNPFDPLKPKSTLEDDWSLISIGGHGENSRNIDIKFIRKIHRAYAFSLDSFHIILDPLSDLFKKSLPTEYTKEGGMEKNGLFNFPYNYLGFTGFGKDKQDKENSNGPTPTTTNTTTATTTTTTTTSSSSSSSSSSLSPTKTIITITEAEKETTSIIESESGSENEEDRQETSSNSSSTSSNLINENQQLRIIPTLDLSKSIEDTTPRKSSTSSSSSSSSSSLDSPHSLSSSDDSTTITNDQQQPLTLQVESSSTDSSPLTFALSPVLITNSNDNSSNDNSSNDNNSNDNNSGDNNNNNNNNTNESDDCPKQENEFPPLSLDAKKKNRKQQCEEFPPLLSPTHTSVKNSNDGFQINSNSIWNQNFVEKLRSPPIIPLIKPSNDNEPLKQLSLDNIDDSSNNNNNNENNSAPIDSNNNNNNNSSNNNNSGENSEVYNIVQQYMNPSSNKNFRVKHFNIQVISIFGNFYAAKSDLDANRISTMEPKQIRRGIFRYCHELAKGRTTIDSSYFDRVFRESFFNQDLMKPSEFQMTLIKYIRKHKGIALRFLKHLETLLIQPLKNQPHNGLSPLLNTNCNGVPCLSSCNNRNVFCNNSDKDNSTDKEKDNNNNSESIISNSTTPSGSTNPSPASSPLLFDPSSPTSMQTTPNSFEAFYFDYLNIISYLKSKLLSDDFDTVCFGRKETVPISNK
ncbi:hypothetical protein CYY_004854 [Polysphondylium violaceum]|uniref:Uncharacterized protein n=1 Tax=Polysphondylium violaceum TaxID=133409 RepID=A0A8J4PVT7_9MYCE|nr:hypothetical protein CYY_004854 [Polysphondylium violaceum]